MPELPDVEGFRRHLARHAQGREIVAVDVLDPELVRNRRPGAFAGALAGRRFGASRRHGKWLIAPVAENELLLHFGMTGLLKWRGRSGGRHPDQLQGARRHPHDRVVFVCTGGELSYNNMRRFGGVWLAHDEHERDSITGPLGPDAAGISRQQLESLLRSRRGAIKAALMDQRLLAGVGNLLSDEILWRSRIHPAAPVRSLGPERRARLYDALRSATGESLRYGRVPHGQHWLTRVRDDRSATCPRCGTLLRRGTIAGRTACWCPRCQRGAR